MPHESATNLLHNQVSSAEYFTPALRSLIADCIHEGDWVTNRLADCDDHGSLQNLLQRYGMPDGRGLLLRVREGVHFSRAMSDVRAPIQGFFGVRLPVYLVATDWAPFGTASTFPRSSDVEVVRLQVQGGV